VTRRQRERNAGTSFGWGMGASAPLDFEN